MKVYNQHRIAQAKFSTQYGAKEFARSADLVQNMVTKGHIPIEEGLTILKKKLVTGFRKMAPYATDADAANLENEYTNKIIASGIQNFSPDQQSKVLEKYKSQLSPLNYTSLKTEAKDAASTNVFATQDFTKKIMNGEFPSEKVAQNYIKSKGLQSGLNTIYEQMSKIQKLSPEDLDQLHPTSSTDKNFLDQWKKKVAQDTNTNAIEFASKTGGVDVRPIDLEAGNLTAQFSHRQGTIDAIAQKYKVSPRHFFTSDELGAIHNIYTNDSNQKLASLLAAVPKMSLENGTLDKATFAGASWLALRAKDGDSNDQATKLATLTSRIALHKNAINNAEVKRGIKNVKVTPSALSKINEVFAQDPQLAESAIGALKTEAYVDGETDVKDDTHYWGTLFGSRS